MKRSRKDEIWSVRDHHGRRISLYVDERDHIYYGHAEMQGNFQAIAETVSDPDVVYESGTSPSREVYFRAATSASYSSKGMFTKTIVEFNCGNDDTDGYIVTAFAAKKERGNVGNVLYTKSSV